MVTGDETIRPSFSCVFATSQLIKRGSKKSPSSSFFFGLFFGGRKSLVLRGLVTGVFVGVPVEE